MVETLLECFFFQQRYCVLYTVFLITINYVDKQNAIQMYTRISYNTRTHYIRYVNVKIFYGRYKTLEIGKIIYIMLSMR